MRKENIKLLTAVLLMCIIVTMRCRAENQTGSISISPANPTGHWTTKPALKKDESASLLIVVASGGRVGNVDYVLETVNYPDHPQRDAFLWYGSGGSYAICNTKGESAQATVTVTCLWVPKAGEGGGGAGTRPPDIPGTATGIAHARPSIYWNEADEHVKAVGNEENAITVRAWKNDDQPADSTWENPGGGAQITGSGASVSVFGTSASSSVGRTVVKSTCIACDKSDKEFLTFVAVTNIKATPEIVYAGENVSYIITTQPKGFNHMVDYTPANTDDPGVHEVIARCGTSAATTTVTVVKVDIKPSETNVCSCPTSVLLELSEDSYPGNGTIWSSSPEGLGGVQTTDTTYMFNPSISTPGEYEVKAASVDFPECEDVCTVRIVKISFNEIPAIRYNRVYREDVHPLNNNRITMTVEGALGPEQTIGVIAGNFE